MATKVTKKITTKKAAKATKPKASEEANSNGKPLSMMEAAVKVLAGGKEMKCPEMIEAMASKKLWTSPAGKTPAATLAAALIREIAKGRDSRFRKAAPGTFALA
jgi:hypothetical protein